jgi:hypothetical protein
MVKTTNGIAVAGVFSPTWMPSLGDMSHVAAQLVPIASLFWLIIQIVRHFRSKRKSDEA